MVEHLPVLVCFAEVSKPIAIQAASLDNSGRVLNGMYYHGMRTPLRQGVCF